MPAPDITGWDAKLTELAAGLDVVNSVTDNVAFRDKVEATDATDAELHSVAAWLGQRFRNDRHGSAAAIAAGWSNELIRRARGDANRAAGRNPFDRIPNASDEEF